MMNQISKIWLVLILLAISWHHGVKSQDPTDTLYTNSHTVSQSDETSTTFPSTSTLPRSPNPTGKPTSKPTHRPKKLRPTRKPTSTPSREHTSPMHPRTISTPPNEPTTSQTTTSDPTSYLSMLFSPSSDNVFIPDAVAGRMIMPASYWDYNPSGQRGPKKWDDVNVKDSEYFKWLKRRKNQCDDDDNQSPINVTPSSSCRDDHEVFGRRGDPNFDEIDFQILGHSLRANFKQTKIYRDALRADFSNLTAQKARTLYAEIKMPSEHYLFGRQYTGEFQIAHHWSKGKGRVS